MSDGVITAAELAEILGIHPVTIDADLSRDPGLRACIVEHGECSAVEEGIPQPARGWLVDRRELARSWNINPDTLSKWLADGLAAAIVEEGPRGRQLFDRRLAERWKMARGEGDKLTLRDMMACARVGMRPALHRLVPLRVVAVLARLAGKENGTLEELIAECAGWRLVDDEPTETSSNGAKDRCRAKTSKGARCANPAADGTGYCYIPSHGAPR